MSAADNNLCAGCEAPFTKGKKGFNRRSSEKFASPRTLRKALKKEKVEGYLCTSCQKEVISVTNPIIVGGKKRRTWSSPSKTTLKSVPPSPPQKGSPPRTKRVLEQLSSLSSGIRRIKKVAKPIEIRGRTSSTGMRAAENYKLKAARLIMTSHYSRAFRLLSAKSRCARAALVDCLTTLIQKEVRGVTCRRSRRASTVESLAGDVSMQRLQHFSWSMVCEEVQSKVPTLYHVLDAALVPSNIISGKFVKGPRDNKRHLSLEEAGSLRNCRISAILQIVLATAAPKLYKHLSSAIGVELWRQGTSHKVFKMLCRLGLSQNVTAARAHVDAIGSCHDNDIKAWKANVEGQMTTASGARPRRQLFAEHTDLSYSVGWDNLQLLVHTKHQTSQDQNRFLMMALCYAVQHRVPSRQLVDSTRIKAVDIPPSAFLPTRKDYEDFLKPRMVAVVKKLLANNLPYLAAIKSGASRRIFHRYSEQMDRKSHVVNLGVVQADPASTEGVITIMKHLHNYVPSCNGSLHTIPCNGDQMSVERMLHAKRSCLPGSSQANMFLGLLETPQEFHKEGLLLQDTMNILFSGTSVADRGTLFQLKEFFNHKNLKSNVMENFQHVWDFIEFVTEGFTLLCALKLCGTSKLDEVPADFPEDNDQQASWLDDIANGVVGRCWMPYDQDDLRIALEAAEQEQTEDNLFPFCICRSDTGGTMIQCCNSLCPNEWLHMACLDPPLKQAPHGDWYCSPDCLSSKGYIYCVCHTKRGKDEDSDMVRCQLKGKCRGSEYYHRTCMNIGPANPENWYCSDQCLFNEEKDDGILEYSKSLLWFGLQHLSNRDAVREGDGEAMLRFWRLNMPQFWCLNHHKYFILGHHLLANTSGFQNARLAQEITWDRVANPSGRKSSNIPLDLLNEFLNNDFKEMLKKSRGNYTDCQIKRCSQLGGAFGKRVDSLFDEALEMGQSYVAKRKRPERFKQDVLQFVDEFYGDALFDYIPPRSHQAFNHFTHETHLRSPIKLGKQIKALCKDMDFWERRTQHRLRRLQHGDQAS